MRDSDLLINQNIKSVRLLLDLLGHLVHIVPVGKVTLDPFDPVCLVVSKLLCIDFFGTVEHFFAWAEDEELGDVVFEEGVGAAETDAFTWISFATV